jgi:hypothetical protein
MKRIITMTVEMAAIAAIMFVLAHVFVAGLMAEMDIREEHNRIHWRGAR